MKEFLILVPSEYEAKFLKGLTDKCMCIVGVGILSAGLNSYKIFIKEKPKLVFLTGWAGAYPETELKIGDVVVASKEIWVDFGRKYPTHYTSLPEKLGALSSLNLDSKYTKKVINILNSCGFNVKSGAIATVCASSYDVKRADFFRNKCGVLAENMEGFGVVMSAKELNIPVVEIRIISNLLENPEEKWDLNKAGTILTEVWKCILNHWR